jgi:hypothetical protein
MNAADELQVARDSVECRLVLGDALARPVAVDVEMCKRGERGGERIGRLRIQQVVGLRERLSRFVVTRPPTAIPAPGNRVGGRSGSTTLH